MDIMQAVASLGFPIVACIGMGYYVKYQTDVNREELKEIRQEHQLEVSRLADALNNNTLAITKLCEKLDK